MCIVHLALGAASCCSSPAARLGSGLVVRFCVSQWFYSSFFSISLPSLLPWIWISWPTPSLIPLIWQSPVPACVQQNLHTWAGPFFIRIASKGFHKSESENDTCCHMLTSVVASWQADWRWRVSASKLHLSCCRKSAGLSHSVAAWLHKCKPIGCDLLHLAHLLDLCQHFLYSSMRLKSSSPLSALPCVDFCLAEEENTELHAAQGPRASPSSDSLCDRVLLLHA